MADPAKPPPTSGSPKSAAAAGQAENTQNKQPNANATTAMQQQDTSEKRQEQQQQQQEQQQQERRQQQEQRQQQQEQRQQEQRQQQEQQQKDEKSEDQKKRNSGDSSPPDPSERLQQMQSLAERFGSSTRCNLHVAVSSGRFRIIPDMQLSEAPEGGADTPEQQRQRSVSSTPRDGSSPRLSQLLSLHSLPSNASITSVSVTAGQEGLAELFWKSAPTNALERHMSRMPQRRAQINLAGGEDSEEIPSALADDLRMDWQGRRRQYSRRAFRRRTESPSNEVVQKLERMDQKFLPDVYEELQERVRLCKEKRQQQQQQQQRQQQEVYEDAGVPSPPQPPATAAQDAAARKLEYEVGDVELSCASLDLDLAFERFVGTRHIPHDGFDDDLRQLYANQRAHPGKAEATERRESPKSTLDRLRTEIPDAIELFEAIYEHAEELEMQHFDSSRAGYILSLNEVLSRARKRASSKVREGVAADAALQQILFMLRQQRHLQPLSLAPQEGTGGLIAPLYCPDTCIEMETVARDAEGQLHVSPLKVQLSGGSGKAVEVVDVAQLAGASRASSFRRLRQLETRLKRLEMVCSPAVTAGETEGAEVLQLAGQWAADPQAPSLVELASRLNNLLSLVADPSPLSLLSSRLAVLRCCLDEQQQLQQQQQQHQQRQKKLWEEERGAIEDDEFSEFLPEKIILSLHEKLAPYGTTVEGLGKVTEGLNGAKDKFADVVSLLEGMTTLATQQQTLKEKITNLHSIASSVSAASAAHRRAMELHTAASPKGAER